MKQLIPIRIADDGGFNSDIFRDGSTNGNIFAERKKSPFETVLPPELAAQAHDPRLMRNDDGPAKKEGGPKASKADIILENHVAPSNKRQQARRRGTSYYLEAPRDAIHPVGVRDKLHFMSERDKLLSEYGRDGLYASDARRKGMGAEQNPSFLSLRHVTPAAALRRESQSYAALGITQAYPDNTNESNPQDRH